MQGTKLFIEIISYAVNVCYILFISLSDKLNDRCEKSKLEVIGLNKGISRKNEENSQLRTDVSELESRIEEFQTNWASQEAELGQLLRTHILATCRLVTHVGDKRRCVTNIHIAT